jgi:tetratricopeptide (TPR) repeat protein
MLAETRYFKGQFVGAEADVKKSLELSRDAWPGPILLSRIYVLEGRPQDALPQIELVRSDSSRVWLYSITYYALGQEKQSDAALQELIAKYGSREAFQVAIVYAIRNQRDEAFEWLDRAYAQRESNVAYTDLLPELKTLHNDPRYSAFLKKIHVQN